MSTIAVNRVKVAWDGADSNGLLVLNSGTLVAVLVCLEEAFYEQDQGRWHLEAGFGKCGTAQTTFADLDTALRWVAQRLGLGMDSVAPTIASLSPGP